MKWRRGIGQCTVEGCLKTNRTRGLCTTHYTRVLRHNDPSIGPSPMPQAFWDKVAKGTNCWEWIGSIGTNGYGQFNFRRHPTPAHRVAWILTNGTIPNGIFVLHRCDNPHCVRPDHLWLGTHMDNMNDMMAKGRGWWQ